MRRLIPASLLILLLFCSYAPAAGASSSACTNSFSTTHITNASLWLIAPLHQLYKFENTHTAHVFHGLDLQAVPSLLRDLLDSNHVSSTTVLNLTLSAVNGTVGSIHDAQSRGSSLSSTGSFAYVTTALRGMRYWPALDKDSEDEVHVSVAVCKEGGEAGGLQRVVDHQVLRVETKHLKEPTKVVFAESYGVEDTWGRIEAAVVVDPSLRDVPLNVSVVASVGQISVMDIHGTEEEVNGMLSTLGFLPPVGFAGRAFVTLTVQAQGESPSIWRMSVLVAKKPSPFDLRGEFVQNVVTTDNWRLQPFILSNSASPLQQLRLSLQAEHGEVDVDPPVTGARLDLGEEPGGTTVQGNLFEINDALSRIVYNGPLTAEVEDIVRLEFVQLDIHKSFNFTVRLLLPTTQCRPSVTGAMSLELFQDQFVYLFTDTTLQDCSRGERSVHVNVTYTGGKGVINAASPLPPSVRSSGNSSQSFVLSGRQGDVELAMKTLVYAPDLGWNTLKASRPERFVMRISEEGEEGKVIFGASVLFDAYIISVNEPPQLSSPMEEIRAEDNGFPLKSISLIDNDCVDNEGIYDIQVTTSTGITFRFGSKKGVIRAIPAEHQGAPLIFSVTCADAELVLRQLRLVGSSVPGYVEIQITDLPAVNPPSFLGLHHNTSFPNTTSLSLVLQPEITLVGSVKLKHPYSLVGDEDTRILLRNISIKLTGVNASTKIQIDASAGHGQVAFFSGNTNSWVGTVRSAEAALARVFYEGPLDFNGVDVVEFKVWILFDEPILSSTSTMHVTVLPVNDPPSIELDTMEIHLNSGTNVTVPGFSTIRFLDSDKSLSVYTLTICTKYGRPGLTPMVRDGGAMNSSCVVLRDGIEQLAWLLRSGIVKYSSAQSISKSYTDILDLRLSDPEGDIAWVQKPVHVQWRGVPMEFMVNGENVGLFRVFATGPVDFPTISLHGRSEASSIKVSISLTSNMSHIELPSLPGISFLDQVPTLTVLKGTLQVVNPLLAAIRHVPSQDWNGLNRIKFDAEDDLGKANQLVVNVITTGNKAPVDVRIVNEDIALVSGDITRSLNLTLSIQPACSFITRTPVFDEPLRFHQMDTLLEVEGSVHVLNQALKSILVECVEQRSLDIAVEVEDPHTGTHVHHVTLPQARVQVKTVPLAELWAAPLLQIEAPNAQQLETSVVEIMHPDPEHQIMLQISANGGALSCGESSICCTESHGTLEMNGTVSRLQKEITEVAFTATGSTFVKGGLASIRFNLSSHLYETKLVVIPQMQTPEIVLPESITTAATVGELVTFDGVRLSVAAGLEGECAETFRWSVSTDCGDLTHREVQPMPTQEITLYDCVPRLNTLVHGLTFQADNECIANITFSLQQLRSLENLEDGYISRSIAVLVKEGQKTPQILVNQTPQLWNGSEKRPVEGLGLGEGSCEDLTVAISAKFGKIELPFNCTQGSCRGTSDEIAQLLADKVLFAPQPGTDWDLISLRAICASLNSERTFATVELDVNVTEFPMLDLSFHQTDLYISGNTGSVALQLTASCSSDSVTNDMIDVLVEASRGQLRLGYLFVWNMLALPEPSKQLKLHGRCDPLVAGLETLMLDLDGSEQDVSISIKWMNKSVHSTVHIETLYRHTDERLNCSHITLQRNTTIALNVLPFTTSHCLSEACTGLLRAENGMLSSGHGGVEGNPAFSALASVLPVSLGTNHGLANVTYLPGKPREVSKLSVHPYLAPAPATIDEIKFVLGNSTQRCRINIEDAVSTPPGLITPERVVSTRGVFTSVTGIELIHYEPKYLVHVRICASIGGVEVEGALATANSVHLDYDNVSSCVSFSAPVYKANVMLRSFRLGILEQAGSSVGNVTIKVLDLNSSRLAHEAMVDVEIVERTALRKWRSVQLSSGEAIAFRRLVDLAEVNQTSSAPAMLSIKTGCRGADVFLPSIRSLTQAVVTGESLFIQAKASAALNGTATQALQVVEIRAALDTFATMQKIDIDNSLSGTFHLLWDGHNASGLSSDMNTTMVVKALETVSGMGEVDVTRSVGAAITTWLVTFNSFVNDSAPLFETQTSLVNASEVIPSFQLLHDGAASVPIYLNSSAYDVEAELVRILDTEALDVITTRRANNETLWEITFHPELANVPELISQSRGLGKNSLLFQYLSQLACELRTFIEVVMQNTEGHAQPVTGCFDVITASMRTKCIRYNSTAVEMEDALLNNGIQLKGKVVRTLLGQDETLWSFVPEENGQLGALSNLGHPLNGAALTTAQGFCTLNASGPLNSLLDNLKKGLLRNDASYGTDRMYVTMVDSKGFEILSERIKVQATEQQADSLLRRSKAGMIVQPGSQRSIDVLHVKAFGATATSYMWLNLSVANGTLALTSPEAFGILVVNSEAGLSLRGPTTRVGRALHSVTYAAKASTVTAKSSAMTTERYRLRKLDIITAEYGLRLPLSNESVRVYLTLWSVVDVDTNSNRSTSFADIPSNASALLVSDLLSNATENAAFHVVQTSPAGSSDTAWSIIVSADDPNTRIELYINTSAEASLTLHAPPNNRHMIDCAGERLLINASLFEVKKIFASVYNRDEIIVSVDTHGEVTEWIIEHPYVSYIQTICAVVEPSYLYMERIEEGPSAMPSDTLKAMAQIDQSPKLVSTLNVDVYFEHASDTLASQCITWNFSRHVTIREDEPLPAGFLQINAETCKRNVMVKVSAVHGRILKDNATVARSVITPHHKLKLLQYRPDKHWNGVDTIILETDKHHKEVVVNVLPVPDEIELVPNASVALVARTHWQPVKNILYLLDVDQTIGIYKPAKVLVSLEFTTSTGFIKTKHYRGENQRIVIRGFAETINREISTLSYAHKLEHDHASFTAQLDGGSVQAIEVFIKDKAADTLRLADIEAIPGQKVMNDNDEPVLLSELFNVTHAPKRSILKAYALRGSILLPTNRFPPLQIDDASSGNSLLHGMKYTPELGSTRGFQDIIRVSINGHAVAQKLISIRPADPFPSLESDETVFASLSGFSLDSNLKIVGNQEGVYSLEASAAEGRFNVKPSSTVLPWLSGDGSRLLIHGTITQLQSVLETIVFTPTGDSRDDTIYVALTNRAGLLLEREVKVMMESEAVVSFMDPTAECTPQKLRVPRIMAKGLLGNQTVVASLTALHSNILLDQIAINATSGEQHNEVVRFVRRDKHEVVLEASIAALNRVLATAVLHNEQPFDHAVVDLVRLELGNGASWSCEVLYTPSAPVLPEAMQLINEPASSYMPLRFMATLPNSTTQSSTKLQWTLTVSNGKLHIFEVLQASVNVLTQNETVIVLFGDVASVLALLHSETVFFEPPTEPVNVEVSVVGTDLTKSFAFEHPGAGTTGKLLLSVHQRVLQVNQGSAVAIGEAISAKLSPVADAVFDTVAVWTVYEEAGDLHLPPLSNSTLQVTRSAQELRVRGAAREIVAAIQMVVLNVGRCSDGYYKATLQTNAGGETEEAVVWVLVRPVEMTVLHAPVVIQVEQAWKEQRLPGLGVTTACFHDRHVTVRLIPPQHGRVRFDTLGYIAMPGGDSLHGTVQDVNAALQRAVFTPEESAVGMDSFELQSPNHSITVWINVVPRLDAPQIHLDKSPGGLQAHEQIETALNVSFSVYPASTVGILHLNVSARGDLLHANRTAQNQLSFQGSARQLSKRLGELRYRAVCPPESSTLAFDDELGLHLWNEQGSSTMLLPIAVTCSERSLLVADVSVHKEFTIKQHSELMLFPPSQPVLKGHENVVNVSVTSSLNPIVVGMVPGVYVAELHEANGLYLFGQAQYVDNALRNLSYIAQTIGNATVHVNVRGDQIRVEIVVLPSSNLTVSTTSPIVVLNSGDTVSVPGIQLDSSEPTGKNISITVAAEHGRLDVKPDASAASQADHEEHGLRLTGSLDTISAVLKTLTYTAEASFADIDYLTLTDNSNETLATIELHVFPVQKLPALRPLSQVQPISVGSGEDVSLHNLLDLDVPQDLLSITCTLSITNEQHASVDTRRITLLDTDIGPNSTFTIAFGEEHTQKLRVDASTDEVRDAIESIPGIHAVVVVSNASMQWDVSFILPSKNVRDMQVLGIAADIEQRSEASGHLDVWEILTTANEPAQTFTIRLESTNTSAPRGVFHLLIQKAGEEEDSIRSAAIDHTAVASVADERTTWGAGTGVGESIEAKLLDAFSRLGVGYSPRISVVAEAEGCRKHCRTHDGFLTVGCYTNDDCDRCAGVCEMDGKTRATECVEDFDCPVNFTCARRTCLSSGTPCSEDSECTTSGICGETNCNFVGNGGVVWTVTVSGLPHVDISIASSSVVNADVLVRRENRPVQLSGSFQLAINGKEWRLPANASADDLASDTILVRSTRPPNGVGLAWMVVSLDGPVGTVVQADGAELVGYGSSVRVKKLSHVGQGNDNTLSVRGRSAKKVIGGVEVSGTLVDLRNLLLHPNSLILTLPASFDSEMKVGFKLKVGDNEQQKTLSTASLSFNATRKAAREVVVNQSARYCQAGVVLSLADLIVIQDELTVDSLYNFSARTTHGKLSFQELPAHTPTQLGLAIRALTYLAATPFSGMDVLHLVLNDAVYELPLVVHSAPVQVSLSFGNASMEVPMDKTLSFHLKLARSGGSSRSSLAQVQVAAIHGSVEALPSVHLRNMSTVPGSLEADVRLSEASTDLTFTYTPKQRVSPSLDRIKATVYLLETSAAWTLEVSVDILPPSKRFSVQKSTEEGPPYVSIEEDTALVIGEALVVKDMDTRVDGARVHLKIQTDATHIPQVQVVRMVGEEGSFHLSLDLTAFGGYAASSTRIDADAVASRDEELTTWAPGSGRNESMQSKVEELLERAGIGRIQTEAGWVAFRVEVKRMDASCAFRCSGNVRFGCFTHRDCELCEGRCKNSEHAFLTDVSCLVGEDASLCPPGSNCRAVSCIQNGWPCSGDSDCWGSGECIQECEVSSRRTLWYIRFFGVSPEFPLLDLHSSDVYGGLDPRVEVNTLSGRSERVLHTKSNVLSGSFRLISSTQESMLSSNASGNEVGHALQRVVGLDSTNIINTSRSSPSLQSGYTWEVLLDTENCNFECHQALQGLRVRGEGLSGKGAVVKLEMLQEVIQANRNIHLAVSASPGSLLATGLNHSATHLEYTLADEAAVNEVLREMRYVPEMNWNSYVDGFDARVNLFINSVEVQRINVHVDAVNDAPVITLPGETYGTAMQQDGLSQLPVHVIPFKVAEDKEVLISGISLRDVDANEANFGDRVADAPGVLKVTLVVTHGTFRLGDEVDGTDVSFYATVEEANSRLRDLRYQPFLDFHGNDTLYIEVDDLGNYGSEAKTHVARASLPIVVMPIADLLRLELPRELQECDEDSGLRLQAWTIRDPDIFNEVGDEVTISILSESGTVWIDEDLNASIHPGNTTITGYLEEVNRAFEHAIYYPAVNSNTLGRSPQVLQLVAKRGHLTATESVFVHVRAVNDAPSILTQAKLDTMEDKALPLEQAIRFSDVDVHEGGSGALRVNISVQTGSFQFNRDPVGVSTTRVSNKSVQFQGRLDAVNLAITRLVYVPEADWWGTDYVDIDVSDMGNTGDGGALSAQATMPILVHSVNDRPRWLLPDATDAASVSEVQLSDVDAFFGELSVRIATRRGLLIVGGVGTGKGEIELTGTLEELNLELRQLQYISRGSPDEVTFVAEDHGHSGSGVSEISHAVMVVKENLMDIGPRVFSRQGTFLVGKPCVSIQTVSAHHWDVPEDDVCMNVVELEEMTLQEDEVMGLSDLYIAEPTENAQLTYTLQLQAQRGMLNAFGSSSYFRSQSSLQFTSTLPALNASLANVVYYPPPHWHGLDRVRIALTSVESHGHSALPGVNITVPIRVHSTDDRAKWVLPPTQVETLEDNIVRIEGLQLRSPDTGKLLLVDITVQNGTVTLGEVDGGLDIMSGSSSFAKSVRFRARKADANQALENLLYTPRTDWSGLDVISLSVQAGTQQVTSTLAVIVHPRNDPPRFEHNHTRVVTVIQGSANILPRVEALDVDDEVLTLGVTAREGSVQIDFSLPLFVLQMESRSLQVKGLKKTINAALASMQYTSGDFYGYDVVRLTITDVEGASATSSINLTVTRSNMPPRLIFPSFIDLSTRHVLEQAAVLTLGAAQSSTVPSVQRGDPPRPQLWRSEVLQPDKLRMLSWRYAAVSDPMTVRPASMVIAQDLIVYAAAHDEVYGHELWSTDGSLAGSRLVKDVRPGPASSDASWLTQHGDRVFFAADGIDTSWRLLSDECSGLRHAISPLLRGVAFVVAEDAKWIPEQQYDCPSGFYSMGTEEYREIVEQGDGLDAETVYASQCGWAHVTWKGQARTRFRFADSRETGAYVDASGKELDPIRYDYDAAEFAGLVCRRHADTGTGKSCPGKCHFTAGMELWVSDLTDATRVADINPGKLSSWPCHLVSFQGSVYFQGTSQAHGAELWMSNGTLASTFQVFDIALGPESSSPQYLVASKDDTTLFFQADDNIHGSELWVSDGQATFLGIGEHREGFHRSEGFRNRFEGRGGTRMVLDLWPGPESSAPAEIVAITGTHVLFVATTAITGRELWTSDGTASGTRLLLDVLPGSESSEPSELTLFNNSSLYFSASNEHGWRDLHVLHFTCCPIVVTEHEQIETEAAQGAAPEHLLVVRDLLLFTAIDQAGSRDLNCLSIGSKRPRPCFEESRGAIDVLGPMLMFNDMAYFVAKSRGRMDTQVVNFVQPLGAIRVMDGATGSLELNISCGKGTLSWNGTAHGSWLWLNGSASELSGALATLRYQASPNATGADAIMFTLTALRPDLGFAQSTEERIDVFIRPGKDRNTSTAP